MPRDDEGLRQRMQDEAMRAERSRSKVADQDQGEDWTLLSALLGGLAVALLFNTFLGLV